MNTAKETELRHLRAFFGATGIAHGEIELSECPDFIVVIDGKIIGIELTIARHEAEKFRSLEIEHAQSKYATALRQYLEDGAEESGDGLIIGIAFEDGIPVSPEDNGALPLLADIISNAAAKLPNPGAITIWAEKWERIRNDVGMQSATVEAYAPLPDFIQNICLYRDGKHDIKVTDGRGGITPDFNDSVLLPILKSKNEKLKRYERCDACDQFWLVIVSGVTQFEDHSPQEERANVAFSSFATTFGRVNVTRGIPSKFDKTYLFKFPVEVTCLSDD